MEGGVGVGWGGGVLIFSHPRRLTGGVVVSVLLVGAGGREMLDSTPLTENPGRRGALPSDSAGGIRS